ncbi:MAG: SdrD B-like domain-containing protein [Nitrosomonadales bacterium]
MDANNNGTYDAGEVQLQGVTITLSGTTTAGSIDICTLITSCTTTTDASGNYTFSNLPAGTYTLTETQPLAYADGKESAGSPAGTVNNSAFGNTAATNQIANIALTSLQSGSGYNFGEYEGSIAGTVYLDVDNSGTDNAGDTPIAGVTVTLSGTTLSGANICTTLTSQGQSCSTTTAANGSYSITGLPASNASGYTRRRLRQSIMPWPPMLREPPAARWAPPRFPVLTSVRVSMRPAICSAKKPGSISGTVYLDANDNGVLDGGETGIAGVTITLTGTAADGTTAISATTTTSASGVYSFSGLPNAKSPTGYTITETQPGAYLHGKVTGRQPERDSRQLALYEHRSTEQYFGSCLQCCKRRHWL